MAIVDNAFREWIADFKATNPGVADSRAILDTAQYAFTAGRKAQRDIDAARQPVGEPVIWVSPEQLAAHKDRVSGDGGAYLPARLTRDGQFTKPLYATSAQAVDLARAKVKIAALELQLATYEESAQAVDLSKLERYDPKMCNQPWPYAYMNGDDDGSWVRFEDVEALLKGETQ